MYMLVFGSWAEIREGGHKHEVHGGTDESGALLDLGGELTIKS